MKKTTLAFLAITLLLAGSLASASPLLAPKLVEGQFIYTIPESYNPALVNERQMEKLQHAAASLHFPFYVVFAQRVQARSDADYAAAVDGIVSDWQKDEPSFDAMTSQVFLVIFDQKKFTLSAGAKFKNELGFERGAHKPYTDVFVKHMRGTPQTPAEGLMEMMHAIDDHLFDKTDPVRVAARKEAERKRQEERRLATARATLDEQTLRLRTLLRDISSVPEDTSSYVEMLEKGEVTRATDDKSAMLEVASEMQALTDVLQSYVNDRRNERSIALGKAVTKWAGIIALIALIIGLLVRRYLLCKRLAQTFAREIQAWKDLIKNATGKYVDFYGERDDIIMLKNVQGQTATLYESVTKQVDALYIALKAMETNLVRCEITMSKGSYFKTQPMLDAIIQLDAPFDFDTKEVNTDDLFGSEYKKVTIAPRDLRANLQAQYAGIMHGWNELKGAAKTQMTSAEDAFPHANIDAMFTLADENEIPHRWVSDHPLFGNDASDALLYEQVNALRWSDPLAYARRITQLCERETTIQARLGRIVKARQAMLSSKVEKLPELPAILLDAQDDPQLTLEQARGEEDEFVGMLLSTDISDAQATVSQARHVQELYDRCALQIGIVQNASKRFDKQKTQAWAAYTSATETGKKAQKKIGQTKKVHSNCRADATLKQGKEQLEKGHALLKQAEADENETRLVQAGRVADKAMRVLTSALEAFQKAIAHCETLAKNKSAFEQEVARMQELRSSYQSKVHRWGGNSSSIRAYSAPQIEGAVNYTVLKTKLQEHQQAWENTERSARRAYEAEQARIRAAEEARRAAERAAQRAAAAARAEASRRSSSSTGSFGGGGSSSSVGGW
ncbi:MAG: hypothetical protein ABIH21_02660 [Patescibacteria group bacterium]